MALLSTSEFPTGRSKAQRQMHDGARRAGSLDLPLGRGESCPNARVVNDPGAFLRGLPDRPPPDWGLPDSRKAADQGKRQPIASSFRLISGLRSEDYWIPRSSTSKTRVAPPGITGGLPRSPYAMLEGQTSLDFPPTFIFWTPSVQQGIT
jgi:hypothetical protein